MTDQDWSAAWARALAVLLDGGAIGELDVVTGAPVEDDTLLILINAAEEPVRFRLPPAPEPAGWEVLLDTTFPSGEPDEWRLPDHGSVEISDRPIVLLRCPRPGD